MQTGLRVTIIVIELWFYISIDKHLVRDVLVNDSQPALRHRRKPRFVVFVNFYDVNSPAVANFKLTG